MQKNNQSIAKKLFILGISIGSFLLSAPSQAESLTYKTKPSQVADSEFKGEIEVQIEEFKKSKKALLMNQCSAETVNAREQYAYSHSEYIQLIDGLKEAVEIEESLKWKMTAAQMRVEIWRSLEATSRAEGRAVQ
jgi:hypothetical protein